MKIAFVDTIGLTYDGSTLDKRGLGGSESAVIYMAQELYNLGHSVTVYNNCEGEDVSPGIYNGVVYRPQSHRVAFHTIYDVIIVSRTLLPFTQCSMVKDAKHKVLWLHDTFIEGDNDLEQLVVSKAINQVFTLSDWHTTYITTCNHGNPRHYEQLRHAIFQTRNGAVKHRDVDVVAKDRNSFVYNASATKGMVPLITKVWPLLKTYLPDAKLTIIGGFYRFEGNVADDQENVVRQFMSDDALKRMDITFTGVITQREISDIYANAYMTLYPCAFPETFGISTLESLLYKTPVATCRFGALGETALDKACYLIDYPVEPTFQHSDHLVAGQIERFVDMVTRAMADPYLHSQKQQYCSVVDDINGWDTVAKQWDQEFHKQLKYFYPKDSYQKVSVINNKVARVFGRNSRTDQYITYGVEDTILIVAPVYNAKSYIKNMIDSVITQDYENYMLLIIDDCSNDGTYEELVSIINSLPTDLSSKINLIRNECRYGAIYNQLSAIAYNGLGYNITVLLDGDDWLINNNTILKYINTMHKSYDFTYGSCYSLADDIPLIAQDYPNHIKESKRYRDYRWAWGIPYTHLRTVKTKLFDTLDKSKFIVDGKWMMSGADNPLFYELLEATEPNKVYANKEVIYVYNDVNPLNDYKINSVEQTQNANRSYQ